MFDRIEMHVIDTPRKIRLIAHRVFPKPPLPYPRSPLASLEADRLSPAATRAEKPRLMSIQRMEKSASRFGNVHTACKCSGNTTQASMRNGPVRERERQTRVRRPFPVSRDRCAGRPRQQ
jgi:hypothetical protein